ncbi:MAG: helix-hairpin-helix domain-containing protein [Pyrinomonadaceae bacterium]
MKHNLGANTLEARGIILAVAIALMPGCVRLPRPSLTNTASQASGDSAATATKQLNINTASATELEKLPGVGPVMAARIIEHRQTFGPFRRAEYLIVVRGMSDRRFRAISALVKAE